MIWFGTAGEGLSMLNPESGKFSTYSEKHGLVNNTIYGIIEDKLERLWLSTNKGISCFDKKNQTFENFGKHSGLLNLEFNSYAHYKDNDSSFYFGGVNGFTQFNPYNIYTDTQPPQIIISNFGLFGRMLKILPFSLDSLRKNYTCNEIIFDKDQYYLQQPITYTKQIQLNYKENYFTIEFAALHYDAPEKNIYRYMLKGIDTGWIYCGNRRFVNYNKLPHGNYEFMVSAANPDGYWNTQPTTLKIVITPPIWKTTWFYFLMFFIIISLILTIIKIREKNLKRKNDILEQKIDKRTAEIKNKNNELNIQYELIKKQKEEITLQAQRIKEDLTIQNRNAELALLRSQINPHFLFNTLNNINAMVFNDQNKTHDSILKLSEIMRYMHREQNPDFVPIGDEVNYIENYVALQKLRFKPLNFVDLKINIVNLNIPIAPMILITFIENAFKHCNKRAQSPVIIISISADEERIVLQVKNHFMQKQVISQQDGGFGIKNLIRRLDLIYPDQYQLSISDIENIFNVSLIINR